MPAEPQNDSHGSHGRLGKEEPQDLGKLLTPCHIESLGITRDGSVNASELQSLMTGLLSVLISGWLKMAFYVQRPRRHG